MQAVLRAMQADANLAQSIASDSYKLSQEMKKDSVAMKTVRGARVGISIYSNIMLSGMSDRYCHHVLPSWSDVCSECSEKQPQLPTTDAMQTLLSMPFFSENKWMGSATRFWLWIVLSVPSTAACFAFYEMWRRRAQKMAQAQREARETQEGIALARLTPSAPTANGHAC